MTDRTSPIAMPAIAFEAAKEALAKVQTFATQQHMDSLMLEMRDAEELDRYFYSVSSRQLADCLLQQSQYHKQDMFFTPPGVYKEDQFDRRGHDGTGLDRRLTICVMHPDVFDVLTRFIYQQEKLMQEQGVARIRPDKPEGENK